MHTNLFICFYEINIFNFNVKKMVGDWRQNNYAVFQVSMSFLFWRILLYSNLTYLVTYLNFALKSGRDQQQLVKPVFSAVSPQGFKSPHITYKNWFKGREGKFLSLLINLKSFCWEISLCWIVHFWFEYASYQHWYEHGHFG